jgi:hypothetical protein
MTMIDMKKYAYMDSETIINCLDRKDGLALLPIYESPQVSQSWRFQRFS